MAIRRKNKEGPATSDARQICTFYEADEASLFITFRDGYLYWCHPTGPVVMLDDRNRLRRTVDGWHSQSIDGNPLTFDRLSGDLLSVQMYQGTICEVRAKDYLIRKINDDPLPEVTRANAAEASLHSAVVGLLRLLTPKDFELLVDLIFSASGWRRNGVVGGPQKTVDLDLVLPTTGERAFVQVKSKTSPQAFRDYVERFNGSAGYTRMFYVWHTGDVGPDTPRNVSAWGPGRVAQAVLDAGLFSWVKGKVS